MYVCTFALFEWFLSCFPGQTFKHICWYVNSKATKIEMYVSKNDGKYHQNGVHGPAANRKSHENLKYTLTCLQIDVCSTC